MLRALAVVCVLAVHAHAQPGAAPVQLQPAQPESVMDRRWSISGDFGFRAYKTQRQQDNLEVSTGVIDLTARYRVARAIEVGLQLGVGGSEELAAGSLLIEGRYRFRAERRWNIYTGLAIGATGISRKEGASEAEKKGRGTLLVSAGVERRWRSWALFAELRVGGVGANRELATPVAPDAAYSFSRYSLSAGGWTIGGTFYF